MSKGSQFGTGQFSGHFSEMVDNRNVVRSGMGKTIIAKIKVL